MSAELTEHLGYEPHQEPPGGTGNTRNGSTAKTLATEQGPVRIETPRDRKGSFEPQIIRKGQRRFQGFDDKILALYSRGLSTRDIEAHLAEIYGVSVGRDLISRVTDAVMDDVREWQQRPLDDVYPVIFLDALVLKIREGGSVQRRACYLAVSGKRDDGALEALDDPEARRRAAREGGLHFGRVVEVAASVCVVLRDGCGVVGEGEPDHPPATAVVAGIARRRARHVVRLGTQGL